MHYFIVLVLLLHIYITTEYHCEIDFSNSMALLHLKTTKEVDDVYNMKYVKHV